MKTTLVLILAAASALAETDNFDDAKPGALPKGWSSAVTGSGNAKWTIEKDDTAPTKPNVLKQSGEGDYPIVLNDGSAVKDGFVEVKGKALDGKEDQAIGVIWRAKDKDNYYVCRANALEGNVVLYKTVAGKRSPLDIVGRQGGYGVKASVEAKQWHTLRVEFKGDTFTVKWNGKELFQVKDSTFTNAGKVGLWTKADSVTVFDNFKFGAK
jgi:3-keto-disaccharide hydrolase